MSYENAVLLAMALGILGGAALTAYAVWSRKQENRERRKG